MISAINSVNTNGFKVSKNRTFSATAANNTIAANNSTSNIKETKWWHPLASLFVSGLGQFYQNRSEDGIKYLLPTAIIGTAMAFVGKGTLNPKILEKPALAKATGIFFIAGTLAMLGIKIASAVDAYKGGKK